nr:bZIP60 [Tanacetum cinerariifolium]
MEEENMMIDWDNLLVFDDPNNDSHHQGWLDLDDIEHFLLNDDQDHHVLNEEDVNDGSFGDILLPIEEDPKRSSSSSDLSDEDDLLSKNQKQDSTSPVVVDDVDHDQQQKEEEEKEEDDPLTKKRKRQLRNKDAALRSRERKKSYVKELEMKSRYYEEECRRLGSVLQCFMAENQALRFSLHSSNLTSNTTSITKQESAVLFLESLLLGSLLWLMAVVCQLLVLPSQLEEVNVVEEKLLPSPVLRKGPSKSSMKILMVGKRFKASRSRMRPALDSPLKVVTSY